MLSASLLSISSVKRLKASLLRHPAHIVLDVRQIRLHRVGQGDTRVQRRLYGGHGTRRSCPACRTPPPRLPPTAPSSCWTDRSVVWAWAPVVCRYSLISLLVRTAAAQQLLPHLMPAYPAPAPAAPPVLQRVHRVASFSATRSGDEPPPAAAPSGPRRSAAASLVLQRRRSAALDHLVHPGDQVRLSASPRYRPQPVSLFRMASSMSASTLSALSSTVSRSLYVSCPPLLRPVPMTCTVPPTPPHRRPPPVARAHPAMVTDAAASSPSAPSITSFSDTSTFCSCAVSCRAHRSACP